MTHIFSGDHAPLNIPSSTRGRRVEFSLFTLLLSLIYASRARMSSISSTIRQGLPTLMATRRRMIHHRDGAASSHLSLWWS